MPMNGRRKSPRYHCRGTASIQVLPENPENRFPARILSLSQSGCLMVLRQPIPELSLDQVIELLFEVKGLPFRLRARAKSFCPHHTVGFEFLDVSARKRGQLEDLIEELARESSYIDRRAGERH